MGRFVSKDATTRELCKIRAILNSYEGKGGGRRDDGERMRSSRQSNNPNPVQSELVRSIYVFVRGGGKWQWQDT